MPRKKKSKESPKDPILETKPSENYDLMQKWKTRVKNAQKCRKDWETKYKVEKCEKHVLGFQWQSEQAQDPVFNHTLATLLTMRPNIFYRNPKFYVRPRPTNNSQATERDAAIGEGILESIGERDDNLQNAANLALWQNFTRLAVIKVCYEPKIVSNPSKGELMYQTDPSGETIFKEDQPVPLINPQTGQQMVKPDKVVTEEIYQYKWVDAKNMLLPDQGPDMDRWSWLGEEVVVPLATAKEDERFPKEMRDQLVSNETTDKVTKRRSSGEGDPDNKENQMFRYYECYDLDEKTYYIWADSQVFDEFLVYDDLPKGIVNHPYSVMPQWIPILGPDPSPWPVPYIRSWLDIQDEYNIRRKQITEGCKRMARKVYYSDATFPNEDEALKALQSNQDMAAVKVNNTEKPPVGLTDPPVPPSLFSDTELLIRDWYTVTGQSGARQQAPEGKTATESSIVESAARLRDTDILGHVEQWLTCAGVKMKKLVEATLTVGMMINIRGFNDDEFKKYAQRTYGLAPEAIEFIPGLKEIFKERYGKNEWKKVTREDLMFDADVTVVPGSFRPRNLDVERTQWLQFLEVIGSKPQLAMSRELLKETASKFEYISDKMVDEIFALSKQMMQAQQTTAGRGGSANGGGQAPGAGNPLQQMLAGAAGGMN